MTWSGASRAARFTAQATRLGRRSFFTAAASSSLPAPFSSLTRASRAVMNPSGRPRVEVVRRGGDRGRSPALPVLPRPRPDRPTRARRRRSPRRAPSGRPASRRECHSPAPTWITSPGSNTWPASPRVRTRPRPLTPNRNWPPGCRCQWVRAAGAKCTTPTFVPSSDASVERSQTSPVNRPASPCSKEPSADLETSIAVSLRALRPTR